MPAWAKPSPADELNCGSCGYNTCREKAVAVYQGKADLVHVPAVLERERPRAFSDTIIRNSPNGIIVLNEIAGGAADQRRRAVIFCACPVRRTLWATRWCGCWIRRSFSSVIQTGRDVRDKRMFLAEYEKYVEMTVIYD